MSQGGADIVQHIFCALDAAAEDVLTDKQTIIDLSRRSNETREALRALDKETSHKTWICVGQQFIKLPTAKAKEILKRDQRQYLEDLRRGLKKKFNKVHDLEGKPEAKAFNLKALSEEELTGIVKIT